MLDFQVFEQILGFEQVLYQKLGGDELYFQRKNKQIADPIDAEWPTIVPVSSSNQEKQARGVARVILPRTEPGTAFWRFSAPSSVLYQKSRAHLGGFVSKVDQYAKNENHIISRLIYFF